MIRYVGRGNDRQVETHGQNAVSSNEGVHDFIHECRAQGLRPFGFIVKSKLTADESFVLEHCVLQAIGYWKLFNENFGRVNSKLARWSHDDEAAFGVHVLSEAFTKFTSTPINKHWRYRLEVRKRAQTAVSKKKSRQQSVEEHLLLEMTKLELKDYVEGLDEGSYLVNIVKTPSESVQRERIVSEDVIDLDSSIEAKSSTFKKTRH